jgi:hypothetical protein
VIYDKLILAVTEHRQFGWKIDIYSALSESANSIRILGLPNLQAEIEEGASEAKIALIKAVNEVSDTALIKAYTREKDKSKIPQITIDNLIRPRIEKNC